MCRVSYHFLYAPFYVSFYLSLLCIFFCAPLSSSDLFFDVNDSFNSSSASSVKSQKNNNLTIKRNNFFELPLCEVPSRDEFFNCVVIMASNPSNFMVNNNSYSVQPQTHLHIDPNTLLVRFFRAVPAKWKYRFSHLNEN